jgi:hypothetical protein
MRDVLLLTLQLLLGVIVPALVVRRDLRRLPPPLLARAWPDASVWSAAYLVSALAVIVHFTRTRRSLVGFLLGLGWCAVAFAGVLGPVLLLDAVWPE